MSHHKNQDALVEEYTRVSQWYTGQLAYLMKRMKDIDDGRLVAPYRIALNVGARFRFICRDGAQDKPQIAAFRAWILEEIEKTQYITESLEIVE